MCRVSTKSRVQKRQVLLCWRRLCNWMNTRRKFWTVPNGGNRMRVTLVYRDVFFFAAHRILRWTTWTLFWLATAFSSAEMGSIQLIKSEYNFYFSKISSRIFFSKLKYFWFFFISSRNFYFFILIISNCNNSY